MAGIKKLKSGSSVPNDAGNSDCGHMTNLNPDKTVKGSWDYEGNIHVYNDRDDLPALGKPADRAVKARESRYI